MLTLFLNDALSELNNIVLLTQQDIEDIKLAKHDPQFERSKVKMECITKFEHKKSLLDNEIAKIVSNNPDKDFTQLLSDDDFNKLDQLKATLQELKSLNKRYAKMVLAVSEFYNTLLDKIIPHEHHGYQKVSNYGAAGKLEVRV